jgi:pimeloyl-ACP methyl ester carboxylesterase
VTTRRRRLLAAAAVAVAAPVVPGCALLPRPTVVPMRTVRLAAPCAGADTLVVLLPGAYSQPEEFESEAGFVSTLRRRGVAADVLLVDAHLGYYQERSIVERLEADVLAPARRSGVRAIWLVGISIGGFGALAAAAAAPSASSGIRGVVAIAPYLGEPEIAASIAAAGGLAAWPPPAAPVLETGFEPALWRWLQRATASPAEAPEIRLAFGDRDRFVESHRVLAAALPPGRVTVAPGGHDWPTWRSLWGTVLPTLPWRVDPACRAG